MSDKIPLVDLKAQYWPLREELLARIDLALQGMNLFLGPNVQAFEREFADYCGSAESVGIADGTSALTLALRACGVGPGDEVITVSHTFFATVEAIVLAGARPVFVDVLPETCTLDPDQLERRLSPRTRAIVPVHLYGQPADMDPILEFARRHGLRVVEDACQAHGALYRGRRAGSLGDAAAFSFYFSKNLGAYGEAGMVTTSDPEVAEGVRRLRNHGSAVRYHHDAIGINARLDELQAVVLRTKLPHLERWTEARRRHAERYRRLLSDAPVGLPAEFPDSTHVYHLFVIRAQERDALADWLNQRGISTGVHYPVPCHRQPATGEWGDPSGDLPVTERLAGEVLSLPMYAELTEAQQERVAEAVFEFYASRPSRESV